MTGRAASATAVLVCQGRAVADGRLGVGRFADPVADTLIDAGVARSRSEALAWCVRLVGQHEDDWIHELREAIDHVKAVRDQRS